MIQFNKTQQFTENKYKYYGLSLNLQAETFLQNGNLSYVYGPFQNMMMSEDTDLYKKGQLVPMDTKDLNFKLTNPVQIDVQPSYDGSVNLLINDDLNPPRLINSRFTVTEDKTFQVIDRKGDDDTNIYSTENFDLETRLFKNSLKIPYIDFEGLQEGGNLKCGTYTFYFKYTDADGNQSDIIAESGIIPVHEGAINDPSSISGGVLNTNANKLIKLKISNLDLSYPYLNVYYYRSTGENSFSQVEEYVQILDKKIIDAESLEITITGFEQIKPINKDLLDVDYNIVTRVKTQAQVQNMLFFGNVDKPTVPYRELEDLSLRILPQTATKNGIGYLNNQYQSLSGDENDVEYYNMKNVYYSTGYWNNEIYRFGIVYILKDDSLSPVFNVRGCNNLSETTTFKQFPLMDGEDRFYIPVQEDGLLSGGLNDLENSKGVVRLRHRGGLNDSVDQITPICINFQVPKEIIPLLKEHIKGFFFVRQKRIPTILAQGLTIGIDNVSNLPCIESGNGFVVESFLDTNRNLTSDFNRHLYKVPDDVKSSIKYRAILTPEMILNKSVSNGLFNNSTFTISNGFLDNTVSTLQGSSRNYYVAAYATATPLSKTYGQNKLVLVNDGDPLKAINNVYFSARAGIPEEAYTFKYFAKKDQSTNVTNLIRGVFTGYIGSENELPAHKIVNIHTPGYSNSLTPEYFKVRFNTLSAYNAISGRYDINLIESGYRSNIEINQNNIVFSEYRGDCYINTVTVRMNRNFTDPETPLNDDIIDAATWKKYYVGPNDFDDEKGNDKINRNDVNAVELGHWVTFKVFSTYNLALRSLDDTNSEELSLTGKSRGYYPVHPQSARSQNKMPESEVFNLGYSKTTSQRKYTELPDVPYIKNIFDSRIMFSTKHVNDSFQNGYRLFQNLQYQDITRQYGAIVKILNWQDNLFVVFENGLALLPINERALIQTETNQSIHMYGAGVLPEKETPISVDYGSRWIESVIKTPLGIYGVDTEAKKIWRFSQKGFEIISDFKIGKFLNDNMNFRIEDSSPFVGLRNVKTHYDNFKGDLIFTIYNDYSLIQNESETSSFNLIFNERVNKWITRTSWTPLHSENINNTFISFDKDTAKLCAMNAVTSESSEYAHGLVLNDNKCTGIGWQVEINSMVKPDVIQSQTNIIIEENEYFKINDSGKLECIKELDGHQIVTVRKTMVGKSYTITVTGKLFISNGVHLNSPHHLYKHGFSSLFDTYDDPKSCKWYDKQEDFAFEFIVNDNFYVQKIFDNLKIISNSTPPKYIEVWVDGDSYDFTTQGLNMVQEIKDLKIHGRRMGNAHYKENVWNIEIKPIINNNKQVRLRNKYAKIKIIYSKDDLINNPAIITTVQTIYTISHG